MATRFIEGVDPNSDATIASILTALKNMVGPSQIPLVFDQDTGLVHYYDKVNSAARTVVNTDEAQTLTNKTLTSPVITGAGLTTATGIVSVQETLFTQVAGNKTHTATFTIPAGATILDIIVTASATWNSGTSATLKVGLTDDDCFFTGVALHTPTIAAGKSISFAFPGGVGGASIPAIDVGGEGGSAASSAIFLGATNGFLYNAAAQSLTAIVTDVNVSGTDGRTRVSVIYSVPASVVAPVVA